MKERVQRERSANAINDENRDSSLYGREKASNILEKECQRLRESYNQHRKPTNRSTSGLRTSGNAPFAGLHKVSFKEEAYDNDDLNKSRGSIHNIQTVAGEKSAQIGAQLKAQNESQQTQINRFKRTQQKSHQSLASYQEKFMRLEQNYKKFTSNLVNPNQSDEIIQQMKFKTGISLIQKVLNKGISMNQRNVFKIWRLNSGVALKQYETQEKTLLLAKCVHKMMKRKSVFQKLVLYQRWKQIVFRNEPNTRDRMVSQLSQMITSSEEFNRSVENDGYLSEILADKLHSIINLASVDLFFYTTDGKEPKGSMLKAYHHQTQEQLNFSVPTILSSSVLGQALLDQEQLVHVFPMLQKNSRYSKEVDMPINQEKIIRFNQAEENAFNKIRNLTLVLIKVQPIGILRLFFSCPQGGNSPTSFQLQQINFLAQVLPEFIQRIFDVRSQINTLALQNFDRNEQIGQLEFFNTINQTLKDIQVKLLDEPAFSSSPQNLMAFLKSEIEDFLRGYLELDEIQLKQVVFRDSKEPIPAKQTKLMLENSNKELVKYNDHNQEDKEIIEDYLDHRKEYYIHQVSVCPKTMRSKIESVFEEFTFVFHTVNYYDNRINPMNLSTSINSGNFLSMSAMSRLPERVHLDKEMKGKLVYFLKYLTPLLTHSMKVASDLGPQISDLKERYEQGKSRYTLQQFFHKNISELGLQEEKNSLMLHSKLSKMLFDGIQLFAPQLLHNQGCFFCLFNRNMFERGRNSLPLSTFLDQQQLAYFTKNIVVPNKLDDMRHAKYQVITDKDLISQVSVSQDVFGTEIASHITKTGEVFVVIPILNSQLRQIMGILVFIAKDDKQANDMLSLQEEIAIFMSDFLKKRTAYQILQERHDKLMERLQGEKVSQETKEMIEEHLILPFIKKQSLKSLGDGIDFICDKLVRNSGPDLSEYGQEISQIAFVNQRVYVDDIRLLGSYSQLANHDSGPDKMLLQAFTQKQSIVYEDDALDRVVMLFPLMSQSSIKSVAASNNSIILRFVVERDQHIQQKLENIHSQLINIIHPVIDAALASESVTAKQELALTKLNNVIEKYKFVHYREMIYFMRDLKAKNVFNFSRSRLFDRLATSKKFFEVKASQQLFDNNKIHLEQSQIIQDLIRQAIKTMNKHAFRYKQSCFKKFVIGTRLPLYPNMGKKKKKAVCALAQYYQLVTMRELFTRFAINTKQFRKINHPKTKFLGSIKCIFRNFRLIRERLAFLKLKKNLNMQLRDSMNSYKENDKELFVQLNQILISSHSQQGGLEGGFSYALSEIFLYLKNISQQQQVIQDVGFIANDTFVGHIDEAIMTLKSSVYLPNQNFNSNNQKIKIFMSEFTERPLNQPQQNRGKALRISFDENTNAQKQLMSQINQSAVEVEHDIVPNNEFESQLQQRYEKCVISLKRDIMHQMLEKSNGITFNFQNIQQSLSDIFLGRQSQYRDQNLGNRYSVVRRSKSALIIPLFDVSQQSIIGSFELYKHHQQLFNEEIEARYEYFAKLVSDFFLLYGQLQKQSLSIGQLKWQIQKAIKPVNSLSQLLKNIYVNGPGNHFAEASHVLPIIILDQQFKFYSEQFSSSRTIYEQKKAFFYQFKDNHIYNFDFQGTFIEELLDNGCILEMCKNSNLNPDESIGDGEHAAGLTSGIYSGQSSIDAIERESGRIDTQSNMPSQIFTGQRHRTIPSQTEKVKTVTNELFKHIIYYPIFDAQDESRIIAVLEVAYKKKLENTESLLTEEIQNYLDQFRSLLCQFRVRLNSFSRNIENIFVQRQNKKIVQVFQQWKQMMIFSQYKEQFQRNQLHAIQSQEQCYQEYLINLDNYQNQIRAQNEEKTLLQKQIGQFSVEKKAKLKFLATSLLSSQNLFKKVQNSKLKEAFLKWQYNISIRKIAEAAFTRVLELNHRHSKARFKTAVYLLQSLVEEYALQQGFNNILQAAHMRKFELCGVQSENTPIGIGGRKSRSRSRVINESHSFVLNNITSLLSPSNLKKIEKTNLYAKQINSLYAPISNNNQSINSSAFINPQCLSNIELSGLPLVQLRPEDVTKAASRSQSRERQTTAIDTQSRYSVQKTVFTNGKSGNANPYSEINLSQVEYTKEKRDYSPIITTSKHELQRIYNPQQIVGDTRISHHNQSKSNERARSQPNRSHSVENSSKLGTRKTPLNQEKPQVLQKQLHLKQMELDEMKKQLQKARQTSISMSYRSQQEPYFNKKQTINQNYSTNVISAEHDLKKKQASKNKSNGRNSKQGQVKNHQQKRKNSTGSKNSRGSSSMLIKNNHRPKNVYERIAQFSCESDLEKLAGIPTKYAQINGSSSPPVRESDRNRFKREPSADDKKRATDKLVNILQQKYQQLSDRHD